MKKVKVFMIVMWILVVSAFAVACTATQADRVSQNLSKEADAFNVVRQLTVINCFTNDVIFQMSGRISIQPDMAQNQLEIIVEYGAGLYMKNFIGLSDNVTYTVVQIEPVSTDPYKYILNYNPKMWFPIAFDTID